ncbi:RloB-like protein [Bifidobacterium thermophilum]|uniref:RloB family protein n=1 Tax=Bifidobacterium thermophilum TaxID=33905 RepID=UPI000CB1F3DB|nr:RloB-like protein [Bifidobacterium thermophilum]
MVGNGAVTEKQYFEALKRMFSEVVIEYKQKAVSPSELAEMACDLKESDEQDDWADHYRKVWVVADVDQYKDIADAERICLKNGIEFIISNPCFEVWLLDHKRPCPSSIQDTESATRAAAKAKITTGSNHKYIVDDVLTSEAIHTALQNAEQHNTANRKRSRESLKSTGKLEFAPWTDMPEVIKELEQQQPKE